MKVIAYLVIALGLITMGFGFTMAIMDKMFLIIFFLGFVLCFLGGGLLDVWEEENEYLDI